MKNLIRKILKEETKDFDWANNVDPYKDLSDYFYGEGEYYHNRRNAPGIYIPRDIKWWQNWVMNVYGAHAVIEEDVEEFMEMVKELVNPIDGGGLKYLKLTQEVYDYINDRHNGKNIFETAIADIRDAYETFGSYSVNNNLNILQVMDIFNRWLDNLEKNNIPLHMEDGQSFNID